MKKTPPAVSPVREQCFALMEAYNMLPHIQRHSIAVSEVAVSIAEALNAAGHFYRIVDIEAAGLLHDITKTKSLETGENHAETGAALLEELGYGHIAEMVRQHVTPEDAGPELSAAEIVSYADKRVLHDRVVSLEQRFKYLVARYGVSDRACERISAAKQRAMDIEEKIITRINSRKEVPCFCEAGQVCT